MQDDNIKKLLEKALSPIKDSLNKIESQLNDPETGLKRINEKLDANTDSVVTIEQVLKGYSDMYKVNNLNSRKLEQRVEVLEENAGIVPPPELTLIGVS